MMKSLRPTLARTLTATLVSLALMLTTGLAPAAAATPPAPAPQSQVSEPTSDEAISDDPVGTLSLSLSSGTVAAITGSTATTSVTTDAVAGWTLTGLPSWASASRTTGPTGTTEVTFTTTAANSTITARSATIRFAATGATTVNYTLTQAEGAPSLSISSFTGTVAATTGSTVNTSVTTNVASGWTLSGVPDWAIASQVTGATAASVSFSTIVANPTHTPRSATITFAADGATSVTYTLTQSGAPVTLRLYRTSGVVTASAGSTVTTSVITDAADGWTLSGLPDWVTASSTTGPTGTTSITFTAASANPSSLSRSIRITVAATGATPVTYLLYQVGLNNANSWLRTAPTNIVVSDSGGTVSSTVYTTEGSWAATENLDWLTLDRASGIDGSTMSVVVAPNPTPRNAQWRH